MVRNEHKVLSMGLTHAKWSINVNYNNSHYKFLLRKVCLHSLLSPKLDLSPPQASEY